jgi:hypothetical protein
MIFHTTTLSGTLTINAIDGASFVSVACSSADGICTVLGNIPFKGVNSTAITLSQGQGINLSAQSPSSPLDGVTITLVAGNVDILVGF